VSGKGDNKKELQQLRALNDAPISIQKQGIVKGWEGKAKGMLQILFEQGFLDPSKIANRDLSKITECTVDGRNDAFGNLFPETSLRCHMAQLSDFQDEETLMQHHGKSLGVKVDQTPKCHPEKEWSTHGLEQRVLPLSGKRSKAKFRKAASRCIDTEQVLAAARQRMFSRRAREHMVACNALDNVEEDEGGDADDGQRRNPLMTACLIEKIVEVCKSHRSAADFDCGFVASIVNTMKGINNGQSSEECAKQTTGAAVMVGCSLSFFVVVIDILRKRRVHNEDTNLQLWPNEQRLSL
jgi:hypothetical protein